MFIEVKWMPRAVRERHESFHHVRQPAASGPARAVAGTAKAWSADLRVAESNRWFGPNA